MASPVAKATVIGARSATPRWSRASVPTVTTYVVESRRAGKAISTSRPRTLTSGGASASGTTVTARAEAGSSRSENVRTSRGSATFVAPSPGAVSTRTGGVVSAGPPVGATGVAQAARSAAARAASGAVRR